ncbi:hypothetical protein RB195_017864 [Necator americanus]|uniref:Uncharacterized protein n=1 Tax=Necator americanus TaxID=51031 RepID=A0ABR1C8W5_NECAM
MKVFADLKIGEKRPKAHVHASEAPSNAILIVLSRLPHAPNCTFQLTSPAEHRVSGSVRTACQIATTNW